MQGRNTNTNTTTKSFKQAFLKNLLLTLQLQQAHTSKHAASSLGGPISLHERKRAVESSANDAMARGGQARWPKAILASASSTACKAQRCRRILRASRHRKRSFKRLGRLVASTGGGEVARRLVRRRTIALRELIPGGRDVATDDEASLLREAMDYIVHLHVQLDVLRRVSEAVQRSSSSATPVMQ